jgi:hypothetical protein
VKPLLCVCDWESWINSKPGPICDSYQDSSGGYDEYCLNCEHDKECHNKH